MKSTLKKSDFKNPNIIERVYVNIRYWFLKNVYSRIIRSEKGWAPIDTWNLDTTLSDIIIGSLTYLRDSGVSDRLPEANFSEEWKVKFNEVIQAFTDYNNYSCAAVDRMHELQKIHKIPTYFEGNVVLEKYLTTFSLPREVLKKYYTDETLIMADIKKRMKKLIDIYSALWN